jgi:hypothetical protein
MSVRKHLITLAAGAALSVGLVAPANAAQPGPWEPVPGSDDYSVAACQTTITIHEKVNKVRSRTTTLKNGTVRTDYKGTYIVKVSTPDHRSVTLDNSGRYSQFEYPNGDLFYDIKAPGLIVYLDDVEKAAFAKAGLPPVFYFTKGELKLAIGDGTENVLKRPKHVKSVCSLLHR